MKNKLLYLILGLMVSSLARSQNSIDRAEYWFNADIQNRISQTLTPSSQQTFLDSINVQSLPHGVNMVNFRFRQGNALWSSVSSKFFLKVNAAIQLSQRNIVSYEYWLNEESGNRTTGSISPTVSYIFLDSISVSQLTKGLNYFTIRFKDDSGLWSSPRTHYFVKKSDLTIVSRQVEKYQYWLNDDIGNAITTSFTPQQSFSVLDSVDCSAIPLGVNRITYRFLDDSGLWSSPITKMFINKQDPPQLTTAKVVSYRYWIGDQANNVKEVELSNHTTNLYLVDSVDLRTFSSGNYTFNLQFLDDTGLWSGVVSESIFKTFYPFVSFESPDTLICTGQNATFFYDTADVDMLVWNYGIGALDTTFFPSTAYLNPGTYTISVTAINSDSNIAITYNIPSYIRVFDGFDTTHSQEICYGDSVLFDGFWYSHDSLYIHNYLNVTGCDSVLRLDLSVLPMKSGTISDEICAGQTYSFGTQSLSSSGVYFESFTSANGCDSIVQLTLMVNPIYSIHDSVTICRGESYLFDGQLLTTPGQYTALHNTVFGCDSTINLSLFENAVDTVVTRSNFTLTANTSNANYQWLDCNNNYLPIPGEIGQSFTASANGLYAVEIEENNCVDTSNCYLIQGIGIETFNSNAFIKTYPNPTDGVIKVEVSNAAMFNYVEVYNSKIQILLTQDMVKENMKIDLSRYANGVYTLRFVGNENVEIVRVIKGN